MEDSVSAGIWEPPSYTRLRVWYFLRELINESTTETQCTAQG